MVSRVGKPRSPIEKLQRFEEIRGHESGLMVNQTLQCAFEDESKPTIRRGKAEQASLSPKRLRIKHGTSTLNDRRSRRVLEELQWTDQDIKTYVKQIGAIKYEKMSPNMKAVIQRIGKVITEEIPLHA